MSFIDRLKAKSAGESYIEENISNQSSSVVDTNSVNEPDSILTGLEKIKRNVLEGNVEEKWNQLLIVGDSFTNRRENADHWPFIVAQELSGYKNLSHKHVRGEGFTGASWWSTRKGLLTELEKGVPKILIMTHTEMQRIPSDKDYGLNSSSVFNSAVYLKEGKLEGKPTPRDLPPLEVLLAGQEFYKHLFFGDFYMWAQERWFNELDNIIEKFDIPYVIHIHSFNHSLWTGKPLYTFKRGITFENALWPLSDDYSKIQNSVKVNYGNISAKISNNWANYNTYNHLTVENNSKFAKFILENLDNYSNSVRPLHL